GRGPFDDAFSSSSVTGWLSTSIRAPFGSSNFGAEISTPGSGPATVAVSGFELFDVSHAVSATRSGTTHTIPKDLVMVNPAGLALTSGSTHSGVSAEIAPAGRMLSV